MNRLVLASAALMVASAGVQAGPVTIALTGLNNNLATGYLPCVFAGCTPNIGGTNTVAKNPPSGASVGFSTVLFNGVEVPFNIAPGGADSTSGVGNQNNIWSPNTINVTKQVVEDVGNYTGSTPDATGLYNVDQIFAMINDMVSSVGYQGITLVLSGYNPTTAGTITETINLEAGVDYRSTGAGPDLSGTWFPIPCDVANNHTATLGSSCVGDTSPTSPSSGTDSRSSLSTTPGVSVKVYNDVFQTNDPLGDNYFLDAQDIVLGNAFQGNWLNTITVQSKGTSGTNEQAVLSAITANVATPEPSTILLFGTGIAGLMLFQRQRSKKA
jgi:hypothetical protein